jgi:phosphoribosylglycinamide formyltransferase-1
MIRLGILGSTRGTNLLSLIEAIQGFHLHVSIELVISNKADALILERAKGLGLKSKYLSAADLNRSQYDSKLSTMLSLHQIDLVVLIGYMRILSEKFVTVWQNKVINVHPSLLPAFAGKMNEEVHRAVLASGVKETGCTVHYVTVEVDAGPIVVQKKCPVLPEDTIDSLKQRVQQLEGKALVEAIQLIVDRECRVDM